MADLQGLLGISPDDLQQMVGLLGPSQSDKDAARNQALLALGLGMMGARRGQESAAIGQSGLNAMNVQQAFLQNSIKQRQEALPQIMALRQMAMQNQFGQKMAELLGQADQTQAGPSVAVPPGAVGGTGMGGGMPALFGPSSQPGAVTGPSTQVPVNPNLRRELTDLNLVGTMNGMPDRSAAIKARFPDVIPLKAGAGAYDPMTGKVLPNPVAPPGYYYDAETNSFIKVKNGQEAEATAAATPLAVKLAFEKPTEQVLPGGATGLPPGGALEQRFGNNPLPYGAPSPYPAGQAPAVPTAAPALARQPIQTKLSPEQDTNSKALGEEAQASRMAASQSTKALAELSQARQTLDYFKPGPSLPARAAVAGYAQEVPGVGRALADALVPNSATALPAIQALEKITVGLTAEQSKVFGSREGQQVIGMIKSAMPNAAMIPGAPETILNSQMGVHKWFIDHDQARTAWLADPAHNNSASGFEEFWNKTHPLSSYIPDLPALQNIAQGKPPGAAPDASQGAPQALKLTPAGQSNATVRAILSRNPTPQQIEVLRQKGYLQ